MSFEITQVITLDGEFRREVTHKLASLPPAYGEDVQRYMGDRSLQSAELYSSRYPGSSVKVWMMCGEAYAEATCSSHTEGQ